MEIQTRREILEIWRATVGYSQQRGEWHFGGRDGRNSISDAEQLLTILYPATAIPTLKIDRVDQTAYDVQDYLSDLGNAIDIPRRLVGYIGDYMRTNIVNGAPDFSGGTYFDQDESEPDAEIAPEQFALHVVDSFSMSISLCLAALGFLRVYRQDLRSQKALAEIDEIERLCSQRLTAAMVGMLRSFIVNTFDMKDPPGVALSKMINQTGAANEILLRNLLDSLAEIRASLRQELSIGIGQEADELDNRGRLFECGWTWGVVDGAPEVAFVADVGPQPVGVADARPYLYFTVVALDGIADLFTERTRVLGLLDEEQQRLARALQLRYDLTRRFWATVATFGSGRWPIEDLPWTTSDGRASDYYSVLLSSIVLQGVGVERIEDVDIERVGRLLEELANRGRITRRPVEGDPAISVHMPGMLLRLIGSEKVAQGPLLAWTVSSYSLLLLKRLLRVAELIEDPSTRIRFLNLADRIWAHIKQRQLDSPDVRGLWDSPTQAFPDTAIMFRTNDGPSWYHTERVVEVLVGAANVTQTPPVASDEISELADQLVAEAEHLFDRERLRGTSDTGEQMRESFQVVDSQLRRARELLRNRPGTAIVLASDVLKVLDSLDAARQETSRMT